jgi:hypothetical protein
VYPTKASVRGQKPSAYALPSFPYELVVQR